MKQIKLMKMFAIVALSLLSCSAFAMETIITKVFFRNYTWEPVKVTQMTKTGLVLFTHAGGAPITQGTLLPQGGPGHPGDSILHIGNHIQDENLKFTISTQDGTSSCDYEFGYSSPTRRHFLIPVPHGKAKCDPGWFTDLETLVIPFGTTE